MYYVHQSIQQLGDIISALAFNYDSLACYNVVANFEFLGLDLSTAHRPLTGIFTVRGR